MKFQIIRVSLLFSIALIFSGCNEYQRRLPKDACFAASHQKLENIHEIFHQKLYDAGPAGWMVELFQPSTWDLAVYVFCPNGRCNLADDLREFDGNWTLENDTVTVDFYQEILRDGTTIPCDWKEKVSGQKQKKKKSTDSVPFIPREKFCWSEMVASATGENKYPIKLLSLDASCD